MAQTAAPAQLEPVSVFGRVDQPASVSGFDVPLSSAPFQATVLGTTQFKALNVQRLADVVRLDASISDSYNTTGYWDYLRIRGFTLDNRYNFRRDGLPINAETSLPLANKERIELFKGTSGVQAGTSAPGGLANLVVKRPTEAPLRDATLRWEQRGSVLTAADLSQRFGASEAFGLRLNVSAEHLAPQVRDAQGSRAVAALAGDWRLAQGSLLEVEVETSRQSQPSVPGFSLLGDTLPPASSIDPRINLNNQPWSQPVVLRGTTTSIRYTQAIDAQWKWSAHAMTQRLKSDDRVAFPFGVFDPVTYDCPLYCDRFAPDGTYTMWKFVSDNERRRSDALQFEVTGKTTLAGMAHQLGVGVLATRFTLRTEPQIYDISGTGNIAGTLVSPGNPTDTTANTNRTERSTELFARDAIALGADTTAWLGLRHTALHRESVATDGSDATSLSQSFVTPWVALSHQLVRGLTGYVSWGEGVQSAVVPNRPATYINAGQALPAIKSRQWELGLKGHAGMWSWNATVFDIRQPKPQDVCDTSATPPCTQVVGGTESHRGLELGAGWRSGPWSLQASAMALRARIESNDPVTDGRRPTNVPARSLKARAEYDVAALPGLSLAAGLVADSARMVLPDNSVQVPGYARVDLGARFAQRASFGTLTWRVGLDNAFDRRAWRESEYQFEHAYLFPLAPRTWRASVEASL